MSSKTCGGLKLHECIQALYVVLYHHLSTTYTTYTTTLFKNCNTGPQLEGTLLFSSNMDDWPRVEDGQRTTINKPYTTKPSKQTTHSKLACSETIFRQGA